MPTIFQTVNADAPATSFGRRWGWLLTLGIVQIIAGGIAIAVPVVASLAAVAVFGAGLRPVPGWGWLVAAGVSSIIVGVILLLGWPTTALWGVGLLLGINLIFTGAANVTLALAWSHQQRHHAPA